MDGDSESLVYIPIPRDVLLRLVSHYPDISSIPIFSADSDWAAVGQAIAETAQNVLNDASDPTLYPSHSYRSQSPTFSMGSSPTLMPTSSRAASLAPPDCDDGFDQQGSDDLDIPDVNMGDLLLEEALAAGQAESPSSDPEAEDLAEPSSGTLLAGAKRGSEHPDAPELHDEIGKRAERLLRLRGGWGEPNCPRSGDRVPLPRDQVEVQNYRGLPTVEGPYGPEPNPATEPSGTMEDSGGQAAGGAVIDEGESEVESEEAIESDKSVRRTTKKKSSGKDKAYVVDIRTRPTRKEATSLLASFMAISTRRHHDDLCDFINQLCGSSPSQLESTDAGSHIILTLTRQLEALEMNTKVFDFYRLVLLMQIALWVDW
jgi:hypothetical protein